MTTDTEPKLYYGLREAAEYLGMNRETFKNHLKRNPGGLPFLVIPANGRKAFSKETLDAYKSEWLVPQPQPA